MRLIPKEERFYDDFTAMAEQIREGAVLLVAMLAPDRPLWDKATGKFPCGAVVAGINDGAKRCSNIHERLNVNRNGCAFPAGYGG